MDITRELLTKARLEILGLRRENEALRNQTRVLDIFAIALGMRGSQTMAVDVAWEIERELERLAEADKT